MKSVKDGVKEAAQGQESPAKKIPSKSVRELELLASQGTESLFRLRPCL